MQRDFAQDWLKKSFTSHSGEKIIFLTRNLIHVFVGDGFRTPITYSFKQQGSEWRRAGRGFIPRTEESYLSEALAFRKEFK